MIASSVSDDRAVSTIDIIGKLPTVSRPPQSLYLQGFNLAALPSHSRLYTVIDLCLTHQLCYPIEDSIQKQGHGDAVPAEEGHSRR
jgi:hypothetical protein